MMTEKDELPGALFELANEIRELVDSGEFEKEERPQVIRRYRVISDDEDISGKQIHSFHDTRETRERWSPATYDEIENNFQERKIYAECLKYLENRVDDGRDDPENLLGDFIFRAAQSCLDDIHDREVSNLVTLFIAHLDNSPILWGGVSWIDGFDVQNAIRLSEDVRIRPVDEDDLEVEMPRPVARFHERPSVVPRSIVEFNKRTNDPKNIDRIRDEILATVSLYRVVTIAEIKWDRESKSFQTRPDYVRRYDIERDKLDEVPYTYELPVKEKDEIRKFFSVIRPLVSEQIIEKQDEDYLTIAFNRYQNASADEDSEESRLTSAIMCIEAILLGDEGALSDKLSRRTGLLLGFIGDYNSIEVRNKTRAAYEIRSRYVHGSKIEQEGDKSDLTYEIMEYARASLVTMLQIRGEMGKDRLINKLDESGLHDGPRKSLRETIDATCKVLPRRA